MNKYGKIADGLSSWLTFEKRCGREPMFCESYLSFPLSQLLHHQFGGRVRTEIEHPLLMRSKRQGDKPRVDFAILGNSKIFDVVIETKWISKSPYLARDMIRDMIRLSLLIPQYAYEAVLIIAGKEQDIQKLRRDSKFQPSGSMPYNNHLLLGERQNLRTVFRFALDDPEYRTNLYRDALEPFKDIDVPKNVRLDRDSLFPRVPNKDHYSIFVCKVIKHEGEEAKMFKPIDLYQYKRDKDANESL